MNVNDANELADELDKFSNLGGDIFFSYCAEMLRLQQDEIKGYHKQALKDAGWVNKLSSEVTALEKTTSEQQAKIEALKDFAIWMTGCGYDFCQHDYFIKCRDALLVGIDK